MEEKTLFEIPVYISDKEKYYAKWEDFKTKFIKRQTDLDIDEGEAINSFFMCYKYHYLWDYNKIVGFIRIKYNNKTGDIVFDVFKQNKKVFYNKINKLKLEKILAPNLHIYVKGKNNETIIQEINEKIDYIKKNFFKSHNYLDLQAFYNVSKYIDFEQMIKKI